LEAWASLCRPTAQGSGRAAGNPFPARAASSSGSYPHVPSSSQITRTFPTFFQSHLDCKPSSTLELPFSSTLELPLIIGVRGSRCALASRGVRRGSWWGVPWGLLGSFGSLLEPRFPTCSRTSQISRTFPHIWIANPRRLPNYPRARSRAVPRDTRGNDGIRISKARDQTSMRQTADAWHPRGRIVSS
jgi:hypothetical protein